jgi:hypothetical protein
MDTADLKRPLNPTLSPDMEALCGGHLIAQQPQTTEKTLRTKVLDLVLDTKET